VSDRTDPARRPTTRAPVWALLAHRAAFACALAAIAYGVLLDSMGNDPRGERALFAAGGVLLAEIATSAEPSRGSLVAMALVAIVHALSSIVLQGWLLVAVFDAHRGQPSSSREQLARALGRLPEHTLGVALGALVVGLGVLSGLRVAAPIVDGLERSTYSDLARFGLVCTLALLPAGLLAPWADLLRVRAATLEDDPLDACVIAAKDAWRLGLGRLTLRWAMHALGGSAAGAIACVVALAALFAPIERGAWTWGLTLLVLGASSALPVWTRARWLGSLARSLDAERRGDA
jgi:hypothetical protein